MANDLPASISGLIPAPYNPREITNEALAGLTFSLTEFGDLSGIVWNAETGHLVAGHQRVRALQERFGDLALTPDGLVLPSGHCFPVRVVAWDIDREKAANVAANAPTIAGTFTQDLDALLHEIECAMPEAWAAMGFEELLAEVEEVPSQPDESDPPEADDVGEPDSRQGEVYLLGPHRLMCGDCTDPDSWCAVLGGDSAALVLTDPPYGVGLDYSQHDDTESALRDLAQKWFPLAMDHAPVLVFTPGVTQAWLYPEPAWVMCWFYGGGQFRSCWGFNCWQPILAYGKDPSLATSNGCRPDAVNMNQPANAAELGHPCPKPLHFWLWLLDRCSFDKGDIVVDPFGGSGTTMIACAERGRSSRLIEKDTRYCDVIRHRWTRWALEHEQDPGPGRLDG